MTLNPMLAALCPAHMLSTHLLTAQPQAGTAHNLLNTAPSEGVATASTVQDLHIPTPPLAWQSSHLL